VLADDETAVLDLLTSERGAVLGEATRLKNQLHALLLQLDPDYREQLRSLDSPEGLVALESYEPPTIGALAEERAAAVRRSAQRLRLALDQAAELAERVKALTIQAGFTPLTEIFGVGFIIAGALAGILGPGSRFGNDAELAAYAGVAPIETSSAGLVRHRLNRGGNRRLNSLLHMIMVTQLRSWAPAQVYVRRRTTEGKTRREGMRALKRFLVRAIWHAWQRCLEGRAASQEQRPAARSAAADKENGPTHRIAGRPVSPLASP